MAVVAFPNIPPQGPGARIDWELRSNTARFPSALTGYTRTLERPGGHFAATLRYENLNSANAARMRAFLVACRGQAQRFYLRDFGYTQRGSFAASELLSNNDFASGTTGWTSPGPTHSAADGFLRVTRNQHNNTADLANRSAALTVAQYAPYAARSIDHQGRASTWNSGPQLGSVSGGEEYGRANAVGFGLKTLVSVIPATSAWFGLVDYDTGLNVAGDYIDFSYTSLARCALVDNGPNTLLQSDELDATWAAANATVDDQATAAPDGTTTADSIIEDATAGVGHLVQQNVTVTSAAADFAFCCALKAGTRTRVTLLMREGAGPTTDCQANFNLGTGAVASSAAAGNWSDARAFIRSLGNGWYYCAIVARKTNAATTVQCQIRLTDASGNTVYNGDGTSNAFAWRATFAQSSMPVRLTATTTAATSGTSQTGSALHLKGLPASTDGLLLTDDLAEIITPSGSQLVRALSALNSDAAGLGYFQFEPPLRESPADGAAVIIGTPLMRAMLDDRSVRWSRRHAGFMDLEFTAVEDMTA